MKVFIYRNLHKSCWSIRYDGVVVAHTPAAFVWGGEFSVSEAGNERVRKEKRKNVHAYVVCEIDDLWISKNAKVMKSIGLEKYSKSLLNSLGRTAPIKVRYRPYKRKHFEGVDVRASNAATKAKRKEDPEAKASEIWAKGSLDSASHVFLDRKGKVFADNTVTHDVVQGLKVLGERD